MIYHDQLLSRLRAIDIRRPAPCSGSPRAFRQRGIMSHLRLRTSLELWWAEMLDIDSLEGIYSTSWARRQVSREMDAQQLFTSNANDVIPVLCGKFLLHHDIHI
jgi:hypothetical protein